jgi:hypothetical protein
MVNSIDDFKLAPENTLVDLEGSIISAAWDNEFYVETDDRSFGIRVEKPLHGLTDDNHRANVDGILRTDSNGERYIEALIAATAGVGSVGPLGMANKWLGDCGPGNVGLLVRAWGRIKEFEPVEHPIWFVMDDGSGVDVRCEVPTGVTVDKNWRFVALTGISRLYKDAETFKRRITVRNQDDISPLQ